MCSFNYLQIFTVLGDLSKDEDVKRVLDETIAHFDKLDILVSNFSITYLYLTLFTKYATIPLN